jgi:hypothetical protein
VPHLAFRHVTFAIENILRELERLREALVVLWSQAASKCASKQRAKLIFAACYGFQRCPGQVGPDPHSTNGRIGTAMELELASPEELRAREPVAIVTASQVDQLCAWSTKHNALITIVLTAIGLLIAAVTLLSSK